MPEVAVTVEQPTTLQGVLSIPQGPAGPPGAPGAGTAFIFTQASALDTWNVNHNLGVRPAVTILSPGGLEVNGSIAHISVNQLIITFAAPVAGTAYCRS